MSTVAQLVSSLPPVPAYPAAHLPLSAPVALRPAGFGRLGASIHALQAGPAGDGSQKPDGGVHGSPARAGRDTPQPGPQQVLKAEPATDDATDRGTPASASPDGGPMGVGQPAAAGPTGDQRRGPATGAQADGCRAPECHAGACSGRAQQDQTSLPASPMRIALWNDGALQDIDAAIDAAMGVREQGA